MTNKIRNELGEEWFFSQFLFTMFSTFSLIANTLQQCIMRCISSNNKNHNTFAVVSFFDRRDKTMKILLFLSWENISWNKLQIMKNKYDT